MKAVTNNEMKFVSSVLHTNIQPLNLSNNQHKENKDKNLLIDMNTVSIEFVFFWNDWSVVE
jgi:hypothetical protein